MWVSDCSVRIRISEDSPTIIVTNELQLANLHKAASGQMQDEEELGVPEAVDSGNPKKRTIDARGPDGNDDDSQRNKAAKATPSRKN